MLCASQGQAGQTYNIASGQETCIRDLAELINLLTGNPTPIQLTGKRDWDRSGKRFGSTQTARSALGFESTVSLREGLQRTITWTREKFALIESCIDRHQASRRPGSVKHPNLLRGGLQWICLLVCRGSRRAVGGGFWCFTAEQPVPFRPTIQQHLHLLDHSSRRHVLLYHNAFLGVPGFLCRTRFDAIVLHTTLLCMRGGRIFPGSGRNWPGGP